MEVNRNLLVVPGLPRCATTSLVNLLAQNNSIVVGRQKEPHYFLPEETRKIAYSREGGRKKYFEKLGFCTSEDQFLSNYSTGGSYFVDASTLYSSYPDSIKDISRFCSRGVGVKFIIIYRNGLNRAFSHYSFSRTRGEEDRDFHSCLKEELQGDTDDGWLLKGYMNGSRIKPVYDEILKSFGKESMLLVNIDNTKMFSAGFMCEVEDFLGIERATYNFDVYSNGSEKIKSKFLQTARVMMRRVRQVNPDLFDNRLTRKIFETFMRYVPKEDNSIRDFSDLPKYIVDEFKRIDAENDEVYRSWMECRLRRGG